MRDSSPASLQRVEVRAFPSFLPIRSAYTSLSHRFRSLSSFPQWHAPAFVKFGSKTLEGSERNFQYVLKQAGCDQEEGEAMIECLKKPTWQEMVKYIDPLSYEAERPNR